jgi:hypothetical protein
VSGLLPALGGGANGVAQLVAGGLSGVIAMSALIATGVVAVGGGAPSGPESLAISFCKGDRLKAVAQPGERMLVTGKSADGVFYRVYVPDQLGGNDGWVRVADVDLLAEGPIPLAECGDVAGATGTRGPSALPATASPTFGPTATATSSATARPTAKPTPPPTQAFPPTSKPTAQPTATPNTGPVFTTQPNSLATKVGTNPLGSGNCSTYGTSFELTTAANDPDGVALIQLWVQKPGTTSFVRLGHDFSKDGALWYGFINTTIDKIDVAGTLNYRAVAIDGKGASATSKSGSVSVFRCDTEASIRGGLDTTDKTRLWYNSGSGYYEVGCGGPFAVPFRYTITDVDTLSSVSVNYSFTPIKANVSGWKGTTKLHRLSRLQPSIWVGTTAAIVSTTYHGYYSIAWTIQSTDNYGGKSPDRVSLRTAKIAWLSCID